MLRKENKFSQRKPVVRVFAIFLYQEGSFWDGVQLNKDTENKI